MRIKHKVNVRIAEDADMNNLHFGPADTLSEVTIDAFVRTTSAKAVVAANTSEDLALGDISSIKGIYLFSDQPVVLKLNGGTEELQLQVPTTVGATATSPAVAKFFMEGDINQVNVTAPADDAANITYAVWGDTA
jgi:hypothetical protein